MAIFGVVQSDGVVRVGDKIRINATRSFTSKDEAAITLVEVQPEASESFIDVTGSSSDDWFLDWSYSGTSRTVTVTLRITTDGAPVTVSNTISVLAESDDKLFSTDQDLIEKEDEILDLLPDGYSSFNHRHRAAKKDIIDWFDEMGYRNYDQSKISEDEILNVEEIRRWSLNLTLSRIFFDNSNSTEDKFYEKYRDYDSQVKETLNRRQFGIDLNKDGNQETGEQVIVDSLRLVRR